MPPPNYEGNRSFEDYERFRLLLADSHRAVCRIEIPQYEYGLTVFATGFLVAPDVVLTCSHVAGAFWPCPGRNASASADKVLLRFGVERRWDGIVRHGTPYHLHDEFQVLRHCGLDYALIRLAGPVRGHEPLTPVDHPFVNRQPEPLVILQHPAAEPLKIALGLRLDATADPNRVAYRVKSSDGSSGSPVFTEAMELVAVHRAHGRPNEPYNYGVPFSAILAHWRAKRQAAILRQARLGHLLRCAP